MTENTNEVKITSLNEFMEEISKFRDKKIVYRGQSNAGWGVTSGAYRRLEHPHPTSAILLEYNKNLIKRSRRYHEELKETITDINLLARLQHYGAATSLVDFTKNALVSLWFACQNKSTDGKVFCLNMSNPDNFLEVSPEDEKKEIDKILTLKFRENELDDNTQNQLSKNTDNVSLPNYSARNQLATEEKFAIWEPPLTDNRILKQDSFFIFNKEGKLNNGLFKTLILCKEKKEEILKELKQLSNFSEETIFPDFYGFAQNNSTDKPYNPQGAIEYLQRGNESHALGNYKEAITDYDKAIELNPEYAEAYNNRGLAKFNLGKYKEAIKDYDKAIELNPKYAKAHNNRGFVNLALKKYDEGIRDYTREIEINPNNAHSHLSLGLTKFSIGKYEEAIKDFDEVIKINPHDIVAYDYRGLSKYTLNRYEEAIKDYTKAIEIDPQFDMAYCDRGIAYYNLGKKHKKDFYKARVHYNKAKSDYEKCIELNYKDALTYEKLSFAKSALNEYEEAIKDLEKAKTLYAKEGNMEMVKKCEEEIARLKKLITSQ